MSEVSLKKMSDSGDQSPDGAVGSVLIVCLLVKEGFGIPDHAAEHRADFSCGFSKFCVQIVLNVAAIPGEVETRIGLAVFAIRVSELADKMGGVAAFGPTFSEIGTHRPGRSTNLI